MQQSSSLVILAIFQEVSYHCYIIQPLPLTQERMALKLISAWLQLVLLHTQNSRIVMYFYCKRRSSKRQRKNPVGKSANCSCEVFVFPLLTGFNPAWLLSVDMLWGQTDRSALIFYRPHSACTSMSCCCCRPVFPHCRVTDVIHLWQPERNETGIISHCPRTSNLTHPT